MAIYKFNVGDKVRRLNHHNNGGKSKFEVGDVGTVVHIRDNTFVDVKVNGTVNEWNDVQNLELVEKATPKFKVGDKVIGNHPTRYGITKKGWIGNVTAVRENSIQVCGTGIECVVNFWVDPQYFDLYHENKTEEKIVITHDGKTTTATLYREDGSKVKATARCAPEDKFDFNVGAKLAMERLMEKVTPVTVGGFKVGDRVNYKGHNGTVICIGGEGAATDKLGVEFDDVGYGFHNCGGFKLIAGDYPTRCNSRWLKSDQLTHGEVVKKGNPKFNTGDYAKIIAEKCGHRFAIGTIVKLEKGIHDYLATASDGENWYVTDEELEAYTPPKYYNGKVVCVSNKINDSDFTVGKIYEIKDGKFTDNFGKTRPNTANKVTNVADLKTGYFKTWHYRFIPVVEDNKPLTIEEIKKMDGEKVYVINLDKNGCETPEHSYSGWHTVNVKNRQLIDDKHMYYNFSSNNESHGFHAYRTKPTTK